MSDHAALAGLRNSLVALARDHPQLLHHDSADCNPAGVTPRVFLSYSHDSEAHRAWVRRLAERLRQGGVEVTLDQWDLPYGADVVRFMDLGIRDADRVLMVCTANYVAKAEERKGGAGYEGMVVTGHVARATDTIKFVPIVRCNSGEPLVPGFLGQRLWLDFRDDGVFEERLEELLRELHGAPRYVKPPLGRNPFAAGPPPLALRPLTVITARLWREGEGWLVERREARVEACDVELGEGQSLRLIQIPAGEFLMGSPATEPEHSANEGPQHRVRLGGFLIGQTPVTQAQWAVVARWPKLGLDLNPKPSGFQGLRRPVETVSWHEAIEFCGRLSQRSRLSFTLPSEAQWEYACRGAPPRPLPLAPRSRPTWPITTQSAAMGSDPRGPIGPKPLMWPVFQPTTGACTTCTALCGSGASTIGISPMKERHWMAAPGWRVVTANCCAEALGTTTPGIAVRLSATSNTPPTPTTVSVCVWSASPRALPLILQSLNIWLLFNPGCSLVRLLA